MTGASGTESEPFAVTSKDGTRIAASVGGHGPPIVLVHGTSGSDFSWARVRPYLEDGHTVYAVQRRGRGRSGDAPEYSLQREAEDIAAVVDSIGAPVGLVGHSFGANCCLEASLLTTNLDRLVLYEPAVGFPVEEPLLREIDALVADGRAEAATEAYLRSVGLTEEEIAILRTSPTWSERAAAAHTFSREDRAAEAHSVTAERFADMRVPTLLLTGSASPLGFRTSIDLVDAALQDSRIRVLEGQGHGANVAAPELLAAEIVAFLEPSDPGGSRG